MDESGAVLLREREKEWGVAAVLRRDQSQTGTDWGSRKSWGPESETALLEAGVVVVRSGEGGREHQFKKRLPESLQER